MDGRGRDLVEVLSCRLVVETQETSENSVRISGVQAEIRIECLLNTNLEPYRYPNLFGLSQLHPSAALTTCFNEINLSVTPRALFREVWNVLPLKRTAQNIVKRRFLVDQILCISEGEQK